jgi:hypothetical protein
VRNPKGAREWQQSEKPRDYRPELCRCTLDVRAADEARAKLGLHSLPAVCSLGATPVIRLVRNRETGEREEVHTWSRIWVIGKAASDREFRRACLEGLRTAGIDAWLEG